MPTLVFNPDPILGIRDLIPGAVIRPVSFIVRTWWQDAGHTVASTQLGEGYAVDTVTAMSPSPQIVDLSQNIKLVAGGAVKAGDIILKNISRNIYAESDLDGSSSNANVEKLYLVGAKVYQVINVKESYLTWQVQLRELTNQARY